MSEAALEVTSSVSPARFSTARTQASSWPRPVLTTGWLRQWPGPPGRGPGQTPGVTVTVAAAATSLRLPGWQPGGQYPSTVILSTCRSRNELVTSHDY